MMRLRRPQFLLSSVPLSSHFFTLTLMPINSIDEALGLLGIATLLTLMAKKLDPETVQQINSVLLTVNGTSDATKTQLSAAQTTATLTGEAPATVSLNGTMQEGQGNQTRSLSPSSESDSYNTADEWSIPLTLSRGCTKQAPDNAISQIVEDVDKRSVTRLAVQSDGQALVRRWDVSKGWQEHNCLSNLHPFFYFFMFVLT